MNVRHMMPLMTMMRSRSEPGERLLAALETAPGSGVFETDERLRVEDVHQRSDGAVSTATLSVRIDDAFDSEEARRRYHPDRRLAITTDEADLMSRRVLFDGHPPVQVAHWDGLVGREEERYTFQAEHVFERVARSRRAQVYGRHVRDAAIEDGLQAAPSAHAHRTVLMTALPCIFNPDGVPNQSPAPLSVTADDGRTRDIPIYTWDGDPSARPWTFAAILRYLVWFHLPRGDMVSPEHLFDATEDFAADAPAARGSLRDALLSVPVSMVCEAVNLAEALLLVTAGAGVHVTAEAFNDGGVPRTALRIWSADDGPLRELYLVRGGRREDGSPRYDTAGRSVRAILSDNNTYRGRASWDHRGVVHAPIVIGDVRRYEMTLPLWPGWLPRDHLDNVGVDDRTAAKALALLPEAVAAMGDDAETSEWFRRHHRQGSLFVVDAEVARLWVLNEDGRYAGNVYNRNAPFDDYRAFDFAAVAGSEAVPPGGWMRRPRRLLPTVSSSPEGRSLGIWIEVSFDAGTTWHVPSSGVRVLTDRAGIYVDVDNPTAITPPGVDPADQNMWYALIDQTFRVRATAVVEGDDRILAVADPPQGVLAATHPRAFVVRRPDSFRHLSRAEANSVLVEVTDAAGERDDTAAAMALASRLGWSHRQRRVRALPAIPWIETGYAIGDRIAEIRGRHLRLATSGGATPRYPAVLARRFTLRDGRYDTVLTIADTVVSTAGV